MSAEHQTIISAFHTWLSATFPNDPPPKDSEQYYQLRLAFFSGAGVMFTFSLQKTNSGVDSIKRYRAEILGFLDTIIETYKR